MRQAGSAAHFETRSRSMGCPRMYFDLASGFEPSPSTRSVANPLFEIYWEGLLFAPGIPAGQESAQALLDSFELTDDLSALVKKVHPYRGNWSLCIHAVSDGSWIACADHSHQSHLFHSHRAFSSSFLRMREAVSYTHLTLPTKRIV